jgi:hypothetical protein
MATTANGTPYVESSDLVANYPAVSLALAEHIDDFTGKVLQVVRATDATNRTTTSATFVDANLSVTITPQRSTSAIILLWNVWGAFSGATSVSRALQLAITDSSNNFLSGARTSYGSVSTDGVARHTIIGYSTPATVSATTYKARFGGDGTGATTTTLRNVDSDGQLYAIEVSA